MCVPVKSLASVLLLWGCTVRDPCMDLVKVRIEYASHEGKQRNRFHTHTHTDNSPQTSCIYVINADVTMDIQQTFH